LGKLHHRGTDFKPNPKAGRSSPLKKRAAVTKVGRLGEDRRGRRERRGGLEGRFPRVPDPKELPHVFQGKDANRRREKAGILPGKRRKLMLKRGHLQEAPSTQPDEEKRIKDLPMERNMGGKEKTLSSSRGT